METTTATTATTTAPELSKVESAKAELQKVQAAIESLTSMNVPIPASLTETYEKLKKTLEGNSSQQTADLFNKTFGSKINDPKNAELQAAILKLAGESGVRIKIVAKDGAVYFDVAGSTGGGRAASGNVGTTRGASQSDQFDYVVEHKGVAISGSPFESASKALDAIVNGGTNPMNLPAGYGKGNSAVRVLESLKKNPIFAAEYVVKLVEKTKVEAPVTATMPEVTA